METQYKSISGFGKYAISEDGEVISYQNPLKDLIMKFCINNKYMALKLVRDDGKQKTMKVHRLVALTYLDNPNNYPEINHKDGNRYNNHYSNLEWCTQEQNNNHAKTNNLYNKKGIILKGSQLWNSKLDENMVKDIRNRKNSGEWMKVIYKDYSFIGWWTFRDVCRNKIWKHVIV